METVVLFNLNFVLIGSSYVCFMNKKTGITEKTDACSFYRRKNIFILIGLMLL